MDSLVLNKLRQVELEILDFVVGICEKNGLSYYLIYGTLLGAIRHKGFIPWDDDIDICLMRSDYERLCDILNNECDKDSGFYFQQSCKDYDFKLPFSKVRKRGTVFLENQELNNKKEQGIFVDIFPLDKVRYKYGIQKLWSKIIYILLKRADNQNSTYYKISKKLATWYENKECKYLVSYGSAYPVEKDVLEKEWFENVLYCSFEGKEYSVPQGYNEYLITIYGADYMQLPPIDKRVNHNPKLIKFND